MEFQEGDIVTFSNDVIPRRLYKVNKTVGSEIIAFPISVYTGRVFLHWVSLYKEYIRKATDFEISEWIKIRMNPIAPLILEENYN